MTIKDMAEKFVPIKVWAEDERPREKLQKNGSTQLSTNELIAVILRSGQKGESALDLSRRILADCDNSLNKLARLQIDDLVKRYKGIGVAKAAGLIAAVELGRRRAFQLADEIVQISSSIDVYNHIAPFLKDLEHEEFWVIYLNRANTILGSEKLSSGGISGTVMDIRILFRKAIDRKACAIIAVHNHPGGTLLPGGNDRFVTQKMKEAGKILDVTLLDHLIVGGEGYYSFLDEGQL
ncbi:DNA repair protein RadC [Odoribacter sp. OttesenSCG-928-J03]|nr:DNA repair protein RadC [Odoribacter sp. OttesenSCG-928-J03]MDL2283148.1 DNA repair protein RadC [Odoribacter sp. OttesenSCG-928-G04]MDL2330504.1 DNA repair protein RadC [Odoribacter sp. OttesenSCG-928-A06]